MTKREKAKTDLLGVCNEVLGDCYGAVAHGLTDLQKPYHLRRITDTQRRIDQLHSGHVNHKAEAAPDLYDALETFVRLVIDGEGMWVTDEDGNDTGDLSPEFHEALVMGQAAMRKAEGR